MEAYWLLAPAGDWGPTAMYLCWRPEETSPESKLEEGSLATSTIFRPVGIEKKRATTTTYSVHYSLYFIVYIILFTICTLLKLYTIGHVAGSGKKYKGYRFKTSQLSTKKTWSNGQLYPGLKTTSSQAGRCARHDTSNQVKIKEGNFCSVAPNEWLVLYINSWSYERLLSRLPAWKNWSLDGETPSRKLRRNSQLLLLSWRDWWRSAPPYPMAFVESGFSTTKYVVKRSRTLSREPGMRRRSWKITSGNFRRR